VRSSKRPIFRKRRFNRAKLQALVLGVIVSLAAAPAALPHNPLKAIFHMEKPAGLPRN